MPTTSPGAPQWLAANVAGGNAVVTDVKGCGHVCATGPHSLWRTQVTGAVAAMPERRDTGHAGHPQPKADATAEDA